MANRSTLTAEAVAFVRVAGILQLMPSHIVWLLMSLASVYFGAGCATDSPRQTATRPATSATRLNESPEQLEKRAEAHAHYLAGLSYEQSQNPAKALEEYEKALESDPQNTDLAVELSRRYLLLSDAPFLIDLAQLYLALDAENPKLTNSPTRARARELLKRAASMENTNIVALQRLAQGFMFTGDTKSAADVYLQMLKADPELVGVREALAELYLRDNNTKGANEQLKEIIRDTPTNPQAYYFLGAIAYEEKRFADALDHYRKAMLLGLDSQQIYFDIAATQLALQKPREAIDTLEKARRKYRQSFVGEFYTGLAYMRLKEYTNALDHFTAAEIVAQATERNRLNQGFYFELGSAHERAGRIPESVGYFEKCLSLAPDFAPALNYLGYMWAERGTNLSRAREMIEHAVKLDPTDAAYLDSLGWVLFKQGHAEEALEPIQKAVQLNEEPDATLFDHLGDVYSMLKQPEKARDAWRKSVEIEPNKDVLKKLKEAGPPAGLTR